MAVIYFCCDGILRKSEHIREDTTGRSVSCLLPVKAIEEHEPGFFLKLLNATVRFEPGLTVRDFFLNLEPWADLMSGIACMNFPAFVEAARRPVVPHPDFADISHIALSPVCDIEALVPDRPGVTLSWQCRAVSRLDGRRSFSLFCAALEHWSHVALRIERRCTLTDYTARRGGSQSGGVPLLNPAHQAVCPSLKYGPHVLQADVEVEDTPFFQTIVAGFLWELGFFHEPALPDGAPQWEAGASGDPGSGCEIEAKKRLWLATAERLMPGSVRRRA